MGISINLDVHALTKLFESFDEETILHIKQAVLEETCRRTVHAVVPADVRVLVERLIHEEVEKEVGTYDYRTCRVHLRAEVDKEIRERIKKLIKQEVGHMLDAEVLRKDILDAVDQQLLNIQGDIHLEITSKISKGIGDYITSEVNRRLKEMLGDRKSG